MATSLKACVRRQPLNSASQLDAIALRRKACADGPLLCDLSRHVRGERGIRILEGRTSRAPRCRSACCYGSYPADRASGHPPAVQQSGSRGPHGRLDGVCRDGRNRTPRGQEMDLMDRSTSAIGLRRPSRAHTFDQGRAFGLWDDEGGTDICGAFRPRDRNRNAPPPSPTPWGRSLLGDIVPAAVLDAFDGSILEKLIRTLGPLRHERLQMILIGSRGEYLCDDEVAVGHENTLSSRYRFLIERALARGARSIILAHNHPSGDHHPSSADLIFTRRFAALCNPLDLELADHLIVAGKSIFSMKRAGLL